MKSSMPSDDPTPLKTGPVFSCNEWDPLEEVVLGTALGAQVPRPDRNLHCISYANLDDMNQIPAGPYPQWVIEEAEEDLEYIAKVLRQLGVTVRRPSPIDFRAKIRTRRWETDGFYNYCPRDLHLVVENRIIEAPMTLRSRQFESEAYAPLFREYMKAGAAWITAPKPFLEDNLFNRTNLAESTLLNSEAVFDAANIIRCGTDLFFLISNTGNQMGRIWLQNLLGPRFRVHAAVNVYSHCHVDSTIGLLRPGLVLLNPERVTEENLPPLLRKWDRLWSPTPVDIGYAEHYNHASVWISVNLLSVSPDTVIVESRQTNLIKMLEDLKFTVIPVRMRHARTLGGGPHCCTLDVRRRGSLESYF
jgi:glycine amidinotransferase/scyllo-inosamine-4-phosphate amidinotransferase 1